MAIISPQPTMISMITQSSRILSKSRISGTQLLRFNSTKQTKPISPHVCSRILESFRTEELLLTIVGIVGVLSRILQTVCKSLCSFNWYLLRFRLSLAIFRESRTIVTKLRSQIHIYQIQVYC